MKKPNVVLSSMFLAATLFALPARAVPVLQLGIAGGTYDSTTQTIMAGSNSFSLYAYSLTLPGTFFLSMALTPQTATGGDYGSFTVNGSTVAVTSGMTYGVPPLESILGGAAQDPGDLAQHGVFPTWFAERSFTFSSSAQSAVFNTQDHPGWEPQAGTGMYYARFDFNISGLAAGTGLHFDLYNETLVSQCRNKSCTLGDIDVAKFAPFSHDAQAMVTTPVPEPETYAMMLAGLGLMGFVARRRRALEHPA